jgi:hypothetical protein
MTVGGLRFALEWSVPLPERLNDFLEDARAWCRGRFWLGRLLMWVWFAWLAVHYTQHANFRSLFDGINLGIHEFGHLICMPFGQFITVLGGSLVQCLVPVISIFMFRRQGDYFAYSFSFVWLATNLYNVALYIADSRALKLDLVTPFGGGDSDNAVGHDWNWILNKLGWLSHDLGIAAAVRGAALVCLWIGVLWGGWILWRMLLDRKKDGIGANWPEGRGA